MFGKGTQPELGSFLCFFRGCHSDADYKREIENVHMERTVP